MLHRAETDAGGAVGRVAQLLAAGFVIVGVIALKPADSAVALKGEDVGRHAVEEPAVVADDHHAAAEIGNAFFERAQGAHIEIVGGFVEQEQVGLRGEGAREEHAALEAAGERGEIGARVDAHAFEEFFEAQLAFPRFLVRNFHKAGGDDVVRGAGDVGGDFLREAGEARAGLARDDAGVGLHLAGNHAHEGGFSGAVAPDEADAFAGVDLEVYVFQDGRAAEGEVDVEQVYESHWKCGMWIAECGMGSGMERKGKTARRVAPFPRIDKCWRSVCMGALMNSPIFRQRYLLVLSIIFAGVTICSGIGAHYMEDWILENMLVAGLLGAFFIWRKQFKALSTAGWTMIFVFLCIHELGAHWTYSEVPYREWWAALTGGAAPEGGAWGGRNYFDRLVHFSYGLLFVLPLRELLVAWSPLKRGFLSWFIPLDIVMSTSMLYELIEWGTAVVFGGELAETYNGTQGDVWDPQKDMLLATIGGVVAISLLLAAHARAQRNLRRS